MEWGGAGGSGWGDRWARLAHRAGEGALRVRAAGCAKGDWMGKKAQRAGRESLAGPGAPRPVEMWVQKKAAAAAGRRAGGGALATGRSAAGGAEGRSGGEGAKSRDDAAAGARRLPSSSQAGACTQCWRSTAAQHNAHAPGAPTAYRPALRPSDPHLRARRAAAWCRSQWHALAGVG